MFTTAALIKKHLLTQPFPEQVIEDALITLTGEDPVELPHHNLNSSSEVVKWLAAVNPAVASITLKDEEYESLPTALVVRNSILMTLSEALSTVYVEEVDYHVDHADGRVRRVATGAIPNQQTVLIYYLAYTPFARNTDYEIDYANGTVNRLGSGTIPDGATVLIDYSVVEGSVTDDLIAQAIAEAQDLIVRFLSSEYGESSTDQGLKTGATYLALSIISRAMAMEALSRRATTDVPGRAKEWQQLSRLYEQQAWDVLAPFLLPMSLRSTYRQPGEA